MDLVWNISDRFGRGYRLMRDNDYSLVTTTGYNKLVETDIYLQEIKWLNQERKQ